MMNKEPQNDKGYTSTFDTIIYNATVVTVNMAFDILSGALGRDIAGRAKGQNANIKFFVQNIF